MREMSLRYAGTCRTCSAELPAGTQASYDSDTKTVSCLACLTADTEVFIGVAGASAQREFERRKTSREARIRESHPILGGAILALSDDPQSTRAWATGARGEELLGQRLDTLVSGGVRVLHDRRIPRTKANIDHIAIGPSGVFVIDAKRYAGRPSLRVEGGVIRPRVEKLMVGSRDCTTLVAGMLKQVGLVVAAVPNVPVLGMLCFVEADWPLFGGDFSTGGVRVLWPRKAAEQVAKAGTMDATAIDRLHRILAAAFPPA